MPVILLILSFILLHSCVNTPQQSLDAWVAELPSDQSVSFRIDNDSALTLARYDQLVRSTIHEHIPYTLNGDTLILHEITAHDEVWQLQYNADSTILTVVSTPDTVIFHRGNMPADAQPEPLDPPSATVSTLSNGTTTVNWMSALPDTVPLTRVTLPGVHDAGTGSTLITSVDVRCQVTRIDAMLREGIRIFDIRLSRDGRLAHGWDCTEYTVEDLFRWCADFLRGEGSSETIVLLLGRATKQDPWTQQSDPTKQAPTTQHTVPTDLSLRLTRAVRSLGNMATNYSGQTLGDSRGKIILLRRQDDCPAGTLTDITDNCTHHCTTVGSVDFHIEDQYKSVTSQSKWAAVYANLERSRHSTDASGHLTFVSVATNSLTTPWLFAHTRTYPSTNDMGAPRPLNAQLTTYLTRLTTPAPLGWLFLDFYDKQGDDQTLVNKLIETNF